MWFLARPETLNQWLKENPLILGMGAILLGLVALGFGAKALLSGRSRDKWGMELEGGVAGVACLIFGLLVLHGLVHP